MNGTDEYIQSILVNEVPVQNPIDLEKVRLSTMRIVLAKGGSIAGTILNRQGQPVRRESVSAVFLVSDPKNMRGEEISLHSGAAYSIRALRPGKYRLFAVAWAERVSNLAEWGRLAQSATEIEIKGGVAKQSVTRVTGLKSSIGYTSGGAVRAAQTPDTAATPDVLTLLKRFSTGIIAGRILDPTGKGIEGLSVEAFGPTGRRESVLSEDNGAYRFANMAPGHYKVRVEQRWSFLQSTIVPAEVRTDGTQETQYVRAYYPGSADEASARTVSVAAGVETTGIDIQTRASPVLRMSGKITGFTPGDKTVSLRLWDVSDSSIAVSNRKPDGTFEFWRVSPGRYKLQALRSNCKATETSLEVELKDG